MQNIFAYLAFLTGLTNILYIDIARALLFSKNYSGALAVIVSLIGHIIIDCFWGILYAFLVKTTGSRFYVLKGVVFGAFLWFFVRVIGTKILELPEFTGTNPATALIFIVGAVIFGLTLAFTLKFLD